MSSGDYRSQIRDKERELFNQYQSEVDRLRRETSLSSKEFPIEAKREEIVSSVKDNVATIIQATTGAGKSLDIGPMVFEALGKKARIAMTQPRRDAAEGVAVAVAARHGLKFGEDVCFSTSEFKGNRESTRLQIQTTGILLNQFRRDPMLESYDAVIVDEAHERDMDIDLTLGLIKLANKQRKERGLDPLKIIIASATLPEDKFKDFFDVPDKASIGVEGKLFEVAEYHLPDEQKFLVDLASKEERERAYTEIAAQKIQKILETTDSGDILVFMPGLRAIRETTRLLEWSVKDSNVEILRLHGIDTMRHRNNVLRGSKDKKRRVIISTNMAETSVTVPGIKFVVDSCRKNENHFDPETGLEKLTDVPASKAECCQRRGRAGRLAKGEYYSVLTQADFQGLQDHPIPEITRSNLSGTVLKILSHGIKNIENFPFVDPPSPDLLAEGLRELEFLGVIDENRELTKVGHEILHLPLEPRLAVVVSASREYGCLREALVVVSVLSGGKIMRLYPNNQEKKQAYEDVLKAMKSSYSYYKEGDSQFGLEVDRRAKEIMKAKQQKVIAGATSDWLLCAKIFEEFSKANNAEAYCDEFGLEFEAILAGAKRYDKLASTMRDEEIEYSSSSDENKISQSILRGYAPDHLILQESGRHGVSYCRLDRGDSDVRINSSSVCLGASAPLMVCLSLDPGKGKKKIGRGRYNETEFKYAVGMHPVTPEQLVRVMPHRMKRSDHPQGYVFKNGEILTVYQYEFKNRKNAWVSAGTDSILNRSEGASKELAKVIVNNEDAALEQVFHVRENQEKIKSFNNLYHRSRGAVSQIPASEWYVEKLCGAVTIEEAKDLGVDNYLFVAEEYCPAEIIDELEEDTPERLVVGGRDIQVEYEYTPGNPNAWTESGKKEHFKAKVNLKFEEESEIFSLSESDFIPLTRQENIEITYVARCKNLFVEGESLEELKTNADNVRVQGERRRYIEDNRELKRKLNVGDRTTLPSLSELHAVPLECAKNWKGESVYVYPGISCSQEYDYDAGKYETYYYLEYFTKYETASQETERAGLTKAAGEKAKANKTAAEKYSTDFDQLKKKVAGVLENMQTRSEFYWSYEEISEMSSRMAEAQRQFFGRDRYNNQNTDVDVYQGYVQIKALADEIEARKKIVDEINVEKDRVQRIIDSQNSNVENVLNEANFETFGLSWEDRNIILKKWSEAQAMCSDRTALGSVKKPSPAEALVLVEEVQKTLGGLRPVSIEELRLIREMNYLKNEPGSQVIVVEGGLIKQFASPKAISDFQPATRGNVPVGRIGYYVRVERGGLVLKDREDQPAMYYTPSDLNGMFIFGGQNFALMKIKEESGIMYPEKIINGRPYHEVFGGETHLSSGSSTYYAESGAVSSGLGSMAEALAGKKKDKSRDKEKPAQVPVKKESVDEPKKEVEKMTVEKKLQLERELEFIGLIIEASKMPKPKEIKTDKDKAVVKLLEKIKDLRNKQENIADELEAEKPRLDWLKSKFAELYVALAAAFNSDIKKGVHEIFGREYDKNWLEKITEAYNGAEAAIDGNEEAQEYISGGMVSRVELVEKVKEAVRNSFSNLMMDARMGKLNMKEIISEALANL